MIRARAAAGLALALGIGCSKPAQPAPARTSASSTVAQPAPAAPAPAPAQPEQAAPAPVEIALPLASSERLITKHAAGATTFALIENAEAPTWPVGAGENDSASPEEVNAALAVGVEPLSVLSRVACDAHDARRFELLKFAKKAGAYELQARRVLAVGCAGFDVYGAHPANEIRVRDLDGDGRAEVTVLFVAEGFKAGMLATDAAQLAVIVDAGDLHEQFRATRRFQCEDCGPTTSEADDDGSSQTEEIVWQPAANNALRVVWRRTTEPRANETRMCPYDAEHDTWNCPVLQAENDCTRLAVATTLEEAISMMQRSQ